MGGAEVTGPIEISAHDMHKPPRQPFDASAVPPRLLSSLQVDFNGLEEIGREHEADVASAKRLLATHAGILNDQHGADTPRRFLEMLSELTSCRECDGRCIKWKTFDASSQDMITLETIPFVSVCNHHVLPIVGKVHISYVPDKKIAGLSKFARVVEHFARRAQVQEEFMKHVTDFLEAKLEPSGIGIIVRADHSCMTIRGVQAQGAYTTTSRMIGCYQDHSKTAKSEFLAIVNGRM